MTKLLSFFSSLEQDLVHLHAVHGGSVDVEPPDVVLHDPTLQGVSRPALDLYQVKVVHSTSSLDNLLRMHRDHHRDGVAIGGDVFLILDGCLCNSWNTGSWFLKLQTELSQGQINCSPVDVGHNVSFLRHVVEHLWDLQIILCTTEICLPSADCNLGLRDSQTDL